MPDTEKYIAILQRAAEPEALGLAVKCKSPAELRNILASLQAESDAQPIKDLELYLDPDDSETLLIVNPEQTETILIDLEINPQEV